MGKIMHTVQSAKETLRDMHRYAQGGHPVPEGLDALAEFSADREDLSREDWVKAALAIANVTTEVGAFAYDFFASFNIPVGKIRCEDRLQDDLRLNQALQDDWDEELVDEFKKRFGKNLAFTTWPRIVTLTDLLVFLQGTIV